MQVVGFTGKTRSFVLFCQFEALFCARAECSLVRRILKHLLLIDAEAVSFVAVTELL